MQSAPGIGAIFRHDYVGDINSWTELMGRLIDNADVLRYEGESLPILPTLTRLLPEVIAPAIKHVRLLLEERSFSKNKISYSGFEIFPKLWVDRNRFQQVIFNLLANSIKFAFDSPALFKVEIEGAEGPAADFVILFRDWGPGVEQGMEETIFDEEVRGAAAVKIGTTGQGLGLWIVRQIVEKHHGSIHVSQAYNPTEFRISIPYWLTSRRPSK